MSHFGEHVTYDGYGGDPDLLDNQAEVAVALTDLVRDLNMTVLGGPEIYLAAARDGKDPGGWTGTIVLQESHISVHTFPARGFVSADVYTCQNGLDINAIRSHFRRRFSISDDEVNFLKRGTRYPDRDLYPDRVLKPGAATAQREA
jgi:S-adenosylmethionine decarboxylase